MSLESQLLNVLPKDIAYELFNFQTRPRDTHPLVSQRVSNNNLKTIKTEHFIVLTHNGLILYGLEIFIYITVNYDKGITEKLLFVSKADTSGLDTTGVKNGLITQVILRYLLSLPIDHYLKEIIPKQLVTELSVSTKKGRITKSTSTREALHIIIRRLKGELEPPKKIEPYSITDYPRELKTKISLFTRAEPQYLFPDSSKNSKKHVLGGEALLKWWLKSLDKVIQTTFSKDGLVAKLQIPAEDPKQIEKYLKYLEADWTVGDIFNGNDDDIAVFKIPLFPDDPKARFFEHLVVEGRASRVSLKQFWTELQVRQEFRLGVTVSVIGVEGQLKQNQVSLPYGIAVLSLKQFKKLKSFVTREDYSSSDGSSEAYKNVTNHLKAELKMQPTVLTGAFVATEQRSSSSISTKKRTDPVINNITMLVRKKQKK